MYSIIYQTGAKQELNKPLTDIIQMTKDNLRLANEIKPIDKQTIKIAKGDKVVKHITFNKGEISVYN